MNKTPTCYGPFDFILYIYIYINCIYLSLNIFYIKQKYNEFNKWANKAFYCYNNYYFTISQQCYNFPYLRYFCAKFNIGQRTATNRFVKQFGIMSVWKICDMEYIYDFTTIGFPINIAIICFLVWVDILIQKYYASCIRFRSELNQIFSDFI